MSSREYSRLLFVNDPSYGGRYPYVFSGLPRAIRKIGCTVECLDSSALTFECYRSTIERFKPDALLGFIQDRGQIITLSQYLSAYHPIPATNWFQEDPNGIFCGAIRSTALLQASKEFDFWFTINARMCPFWQGKAVFLPPAFDEDIYNDLGLPRDYFVSFVGFLGHELSTAMYWPYMKELARFGSEAALCLERPLGVPLLPKTMERAIRQQYIQKVLRLLPIWPYSWHNPGNEYDKARLINRSRIHFGLSRVRGYWESDLKALLPLYARDEHDLFYQPKGRLFHAVGAGAMALNDYFPEIERLFEIGKEIVTFAFGDIRELVDKLTWYHQHDSERERIARAGFKRGRQQHTFGARIRQMISVIAQETREPI
jgi:hypothetical protein